MISSRRVRVPAPVLDLRSTRETTTVPTYQYACTNPEGKHEFERVQSFSDAPVSECPECGAPVRKVYGSVGVVFKGSGFYRTDSRKSATASETASSGGSSSTTKESSSSTSSSSKDGSSSSTSSPAPAASTSSGSGSKAAN
jgi:putative FmdB family regulatory protein